MSNSKIHMVTGRNVITTDMEIIPISDFLYRELERNEIVNDTFGIINENDTRYRSLSMKDTLKLIDEYLK
ncbi:hypothetical protein HNP86_001909 [Methanococcus maripaludis]|uniref:Uncharacterized protein n=1 Tax=Methanococcus maripaludis TaxID=39152 RepID=A0A7J9NVP3_METMI|nr:hypothetical protein [Methanococcus maripaludis]MBA2851750.1 hypothetical protein [Methanococcus maripaludis]